MESLVLLVGRPWSGLTVLYCTLIRSNTVRSYWKPMEANAHSRSYFIRSCDHATPTVHIAITRRGHRSFLHLFNIALNQCAVGHARPACSKLLYKLSTRDSNTTAHQTGPQSSRAPLTHDLGIGLYGPSLHHADWALTVTLPPPQPFIFIHVRSSKAAKFPNV